MDKKSTDLSASRDHCDAVIAATAIAPSILGAKGRYVATLMRVDDAYQEEAAELAQQLQTAQEAKAQEEVARLIARLHALPRHQVWEDTIENIVTTVGRNDMADRYLSGSGWTSTVYMGLKGTGTAVAADTQASHASWSEVGGTNAPAYSGNRPTPTLSAASGGVKQTSSAVSFTFSSGGTVAGCFINVGGSATKDNTTGVLFSAGDFTGGNKSVADTDVLNVSWSLTLTSS